MTDASASVLQACSSALCDLVAGATSVVAVHSHRSRSSGFIWRPGLIVTADDALAENGDIAVVTRDGRTLPATLAGRDPTTDVTLLRVEHADLPPAALSSDPLRAAALVIVAGAQDAAPAAALGVVSVVAGPWQSMRGGKIDARIELDVSLRRSSEGGLVLDAGGRGIGMAVSGARGRVLVIPAVTIDRVAARLDRDGRIGRGYLGLGLQPVRRPDGGGGAMVMSVSPQGPGHAAGIRQGDVLVAVDGQPIRSVPALMRTLGTESIGTSRRLSISRAGEGLEVSLIVAERPDP